MESSSVMSSMPSGKNQGGLKLRKGQEKLKQGIQKEPGRALFNVQFPTGYGKTLAFAIAYQQYRELGIVNRALVVVPTTAQREQYEEGFGEACAKIGLAIVGVKRVDGDAATLRYHYENRAEVFVVGVDKLRQNIGHIHNLMNKGRWMLVADEHHHYAEDMAWGNAVKEAQSMAERTLAMSATPFRNGGEVSIFGPPDKDMVVSLSQASEEKAIKRIKAHIEHYFVDVIDVNGELTRLTTESLRINQTLPETLSAWETKQQLRYLNKYLSPLISSAVACLSSKQIEYPGQHQMIVYAMSCKHAQALTESVKTVGLGEVSVDWVGVGQFGRTEEENKQVLSDFKKGKTDCLVQVNKAGEGFDVCRASVLVFLNLLGSSPQAEQQIGRGLRRNYAISDYSRDICDIFVPADSSLVDLVRSLEELTSDEKEAKEHGSGEGDDGGFRLESLPTWQLVDARHDRSEEIWVINTNDPRVISVAKEMEASYAQSGRRFSAEDQEDLANVAKAMSQLLNRQKQAQSEDERLEQAKARVSKAVNVCASNCVKIRAKLTGSYERSLIGDYAKRIHGQWKRLGNAGHQGMMLDEYHKKYDWVEVLNLSLKSGEIPEWLSI